MAAAASELKCTEVVVLDVRGLTAVCDWAIIASGTSDRQMRAVAQHLEDMGKERGMPPYRQSKDPRATWIVVDFVDTVVHIFSPAAGPEGGRGPPVSLSPVIASGDTPVHTGMPVSASRP